MPRSAVVGPRNSLFSASTPCTNALRAAWSVTMLRRIAMSVPPVVVAVIVLVIAVVAVPVPVPVVGAVVAEVLGERVDDLLHQVDRRREVPRRQPVVVHASA